MLIASSLLLLAIVSAIVAFRGWPELEASEDGTQGLIIGDARAPVAVAELRVNGDGRELTASGAAARGGDSDGSLVGRGGPGDRVGHGDGPGSGVQRTGGGGNVTPGGEAALPGLPAVPEPIPGSTDEVRNGVSNLTEGTTQGVGDTLNGVNPNLGAPLSNTGKALGEAVEQNVPKSGTQPVNGVPLMMP